MGIGLKYLVPKCIQKIQIFERKTKNYAGTHDTEKEKDTFR